MILREQILNQLHAKKPSLLAFEEQYKYETRAYEDALRKLCQLSLQALETRLAAHETCGAFPTREFEAAATPCRSFVREFSHHAEARAWACDALLGHVTLAVDGSQILPS